MTGLWVPSFPMIGFEYRLNECPGATVFSAAVRYAKASESYD